MVRIVLNDDQVKLLSQAKEPIEFRDARGRHLGYFEHGVTEDDIELALKSLRSEGPRYTTEEVLKHLQSLEQR